MFRYALAVAIILAPLSAQAEASEQDMALACQRWIADAVGSGRATVILRRGADAQGYLFEVGIRADTPDTWQTVNCRADPKSGRLTREPGSGLVRQKVD